MPIPVPWMHAFIDVPAERGDAALAFWSAATGWAADGTWDGHPEFTSLEPPDGSAYVHVQTIDGPTRVHLDLLGDLATDVARLEELGAHPQGPGNERWFVLTSPAGLPFCLVDEGRPKTRPGATSWPDGHRSRVVQVCVDVPADRFDTELAFWRAATGWADEPVRPPEFRRLVHRATSPLQLLVQRLGRDDPADRARAHIDLGADDIPAEVARLVQLGATVRSETEGITVLVDPLGLPLCVTGNRPDR